MSKSDQFAIPADAPATAPKPKYLALRIAGIGCVAVLLLVGLFTFATVMRYMNARQQPRNQQQVLQSLSGVPIYPSAKYDGDLTSDLNGGLATEKGMDSYALRTVAGLRTSDDPKRVLSFYDASMMGYGFTKTTLGGATMVKTKNYIDGASYTAPDITVVVQINSDPGEDNQLLLYRFDRISRGMLKQPGNIVTPEDFERAKKAAAKKKQDAEKQKQAPKK